MISEEIRMFDVKKGRSGEITHAVVCNGHSHFVCNGNLSILANTYHTETYTCDSDECQGEGSETADAKLFDHASQKRLGLEAYVPQGLVLVVYHKSDKQHSVYSSGQKVTPYELEAGTLLTDGEGLAFSEPDYGWSNNYSTHYIRNSSGVQERIRVGRKGRKRTDKKLAKLRQGERKSELSHDVIRLNEQMMELMQLHRTPQVIEQIENVKGLLRLASSLSVEVSIEAAEGNEQIACELANARAREIGSDLQRTRERLLLEKKIREEVKQELSDNYED